MFHWTLDQVLPSSRAQVLLPRVLEPLLLLKVDGGSGQQQLPLRQE